MKKRPEKTAEHKHLKVSNGLRQALLEGEFQPGGFFPGERLLAERFGVSYMTARRAIETLVAEGLCERFGKRTMVAHDALHIAESVHLNLLCFHLDTFSTPLLKAVEGIAREHGWMTRLTIVHGTNDHLALRAIASGAPCLLLLPATSALRGKIGRALREPHGPVVLVGNRTEVESVPWVKADDRAGMRLAIAHLRKLGHRTILFVHDRIVHQPMEEFLEEWRRQTPVQTTLSVNTKSMEARPRIARQAIKRYLAKHPSPSSIICENDELAVGVLHGLRDLGVKVPADVSMISFGDTVLAEYSVPELSVVDVCFERHIRVATDLILNALRSGEPGKGAHIIQPRLILRKSTAPARARSRR